MDIQTRNLAWANASQTAVFMEANFPWVPDEWIPFVATPDYDTDYGRALFSAALAGELGEIGPFVPPEIDVPVAQSVFRAQFKLALLQLGLLDTVEAFVAGASREVQINWSERIEFERNHPLVLQVASELGKTPSDIDALFTLANSL